MKKLASPFQSPIHAKRAYREIKLMKLLTKRNTNVGVNCYGRGSVSSISRSLSCWTFLHLTRHWPPSKICMWAMHVLLDLKITFFLFPIIHSLTLSPSPSSLYSYLVTSFMQSDLDKAIRIQSITDEQVQLLVYQIFRGLKVCIQN